MKTPPRLARLLLPINPLPRMTMKTPRKPGLRPWPLLVPCLALLWISLGFHQAAAQAMPTPPNQLTYQGFLVDANGNALATNAPKNYDIIFRIYNDPISATPLWSEQQTVTVDRGNFSVILGEGVVVTGESRGSLADLFKGASASDRYIGLTVKGIGAGDGFVPILPRLRLLTSPYAFLALQATKLVKPDGSDLFTADSGGAGINTSPEAGVALKVSGGIKADRVEATTLTGFGTTPLGGIIMWSGSESAVPAGWALCNGQTSNGRLTPDLRGRFVVGAQGSQPVGTVGGASTATLALANLPSHTHGVSGSTTGDGAHHHDYDDIYTSENFGPWGNRGWLGMRGNDYDNGPHFTRRSTYPTLNHSHSFNVTSTPAGNGQAFSTVPPFYALAFIMRVQ